MPGGPPAATLVAVPFVLAVGLALSDVTAGNPSFDWVGVRNFERIFDDPVFWQALGNTFVFTRCCFERDIERFRLEAELERAGVVISGRRFGQAA